MSLINIIISRIEASRAADREMQYGWNTIPDFEIIVPHCLHVDFCHCLGLGHDRTLFNILFEKQIYLKWNL